MALTGQIWPKMFTVKLAIRWSGHWRSCILCI